jgi:hypothetical protein
VLRIGTAAPLDPELPGTVGVEVGLDREAHVTRKLLGSAADQQMMIGVVHYRLRHLRRCAHTLETGDATRPALRAVHAARVELHDTVGVRQSTVADPRLLWIELRDVHAGDERIQHILAAGNAQEGLLDRAARPAVSEHEAAVIRDDQRLDGRPDEDLRCVGLGWGDQWGCGSHQRRCRGEAGGARCADGAGTNEIAT